MKANKHTLIIDGSYFLFRTLYIIPRKSKKKKLLDTKEDKDFFMRKLTTDFAYQIRIFKPLIDQVVWTVDSRSWRKDFFPEAEYKGNRESDDKVNWDAFFEITKEFLKILGNEGVVISKVAGAEADDLIYAWNTECLSKGRSTIMLTGDQDLIQLVHKNSMDDNYSILFSPAHNKLYVHEGFEKWLYKEDETADIFSALKSTVKPHAHTKKVLIDLLSKKKLSLIEIEPEEFRFRKVLVGDKGDNVPPAYYYFTKTGRRMGISNSKADEVIAEFKAKHNKLSYLHLHSDDLIKDLANITIRVLNTKHMTREAIIGNLKSNVNLMVLSNESIPKGILDDMFSNVESNIEESVKDLNYLSNVKEILKDTEWEKKTDSFTSSVFEKDENPDDFSFIKK